MTGTMIRLLVVAMMMLSASAVVAQPNPCALLTSAEATKLVARGKPTYNEPSTMNVAGGNGSLCQYEHGQLGVWRAPNAQQNLEAYIKSWKTETGPRSPVSGVGDRAWIMFPVPENKYKDRAAFLIAQVGTRVVTVALFAHNGNAETSLGDMCRGDQSKMRPREKEDCQKVLADKSETQQSLQPALVELAKLVVEKVQKGS